MVQAILQASSKLRQPVSGLTHLAGAVLSVIALIWTVWVATRNDLAWQLVSAVTFCGGMILLYTSSSLYHLLPLTEQGVRRLRRLDHSMIYIFIAASYTPFCLGPLWKGWGLPALIAIWVLAALGVGLKLFWLESSRWIRIGLYLAMGWVSVLIFSPLWENLPRPGFFWLAAGGLAYSLGALIYALRRPDPFPGVFGFHEIWHLFVMAGSFCHFCAVAGYVLLP